MKMIWNISANEKIICNKLNVIRYLKVYKLQNINYWYYAGIETRGRVGMFYICSYEWEVRCRQHFTRDTSNNCIAVNILLKKTSAWFVGLWPKIWNVALTLSRSISLDPQY